MRLLAKVETSVLFNELLIRYRKTPDKMPRMGKMTFPEFLLALSLTPVPNIELIVVDKTGRFMMVWRDDADFKGWHFPGSLVLFGESTVEGSCRRVTEREGGIEIYKPKLIGVCDNYDLKRNKRHFEGHGYPNHLVALIFVAKLKGKPSKDKKIKFFKRMPKNILTSHIPIWKVLLSYRKTGYFVPVVDN